MNDRNITWHNAEISAAQRQEVMKQRGAVLWFTGLSASGKSTIARRVETKLIEMKHAAYVLDGDNIRHRLNRDLGFSPEDRTENIRRIGEVASLFADAQILALTAFISPYRSDRQAARDAAESAGAPFLEVFVDTPLEVCEERDPKGLYKKARAGEIPEFTGISAPYEAPESPEFVLDTSKDGDVDACAEKVIAFLVDSGILPKE